MDKTVLGGVLSFVAEGIIVFNERGEITQLNPHASLLLDYTTDELSGKHVDSALSVHFDETPLALEETVFQTVFVSKKIFSVPRGKTAYLQSKSGRTFPVFISARSIGTESTLQGVVVFRDITTEKALENYKKNTAERLSTLTPFLQRTATGDFLSGVNVPEKEDEFTELFVGLKLMVDDLREVEKQRERDQAEKIEAIKKTEEERRTLSEQYSKELEKKVEEKTKELSQSKLHIETIVENLTSGLLEFDSEFTLLRMNQAAEDLLGISRAEVIGKQITPKDIDKDRWQALVQVSYPALAPTAKKIRREATGLNADVNELTIHHPLERELQVITAPIIDPSTGERRGFVKGIRDITREKMIARSKSEFISIAAHQLRTPLSAIKWTIHMVINGDLGPLNPSQVKLLTNGYETNEKMIQLVNDLLNVARIEDGRFGYDFKQNDLLKVITGVMGGVKHMSTEKAVTVELVTPPEGLGLFVFDANKTALALQNLVDNAVKYTPAGGKVTVEITKQDQYVHVTVRDTGIGVPQEQLSRLFTKFFRAENALHMQTSGSGLGLYIVKNIILRHGGKFDVQSKEGEGSVFSVTLPTDENLIPKEETTGEEY
ncbi:MAG: hypothetical protein A2408_03080 [Candidatus Yonathbacteria bacterium RIFOXYC1_FULL_52_10]|uniref:histidine kinase n=1 Tax=Candidatus Yonathbacteria bacterium RIFOXYD1_FULL_52_36 TaxID=1802730 RepID=A0A1G2SJL8_9BACT|nr:MAG: hypothetical protein A2408_03080 [Candidatus Yonathbacteria bacterium RIFOXYC1_FULL_52_10]OHA84932.1 MAG: hypothetical protein A2591_01235 [Candidatus Yonathbacteria bacterium RIFOXYD1_FULL_52_36]